MSMKYVLPVVSMGVNGMRMAYIVYIQITLIFYIGLHSDTYYTL